MTVQAIANERLAHVRTIKGAAAELKQRDEHTAATETAIRRGVLDGSIRHVRVGTKYLVTIEAVEAFFRGETQPIQAQAGAVNGIRRIEA